MNECKSCKYFYAYGNPVNHSGQCRKNAPVNKWPEVWPQDWCGEHEVKIKAMEA